MAGPVPVANGLADIYPNAALLAQAPRWDNLLAKFQSTYGHPAAFVARSPGRVNIIGEHIDYSLYSVLPMAITADVLLAVSPIQDRQPSQTTSTDSGSASSSSSTTFKVRIANVQDGKFASSEFDVPADGDVDIDAARFEWTNYFKSGLRGALGLLRKKHGRGFRPRGMEIMMDGTVPPGGGLSSSAAFVSASALAVMVANGETSVDKTKLTELAIVSERAVGVNSGGMDQAASVFSEQGSALFVSFSPRLTARPVKFPPTNPELCFLIAQSFVTSNKQVTGPIHYNLRVVEVSMAAAFLHAALNPPGAELAEDAGPLGISLKGFHNAFFYHQSGSDYRAAKSLSEEEELKKLIEVVKDTLTKVDGYTKEDVAEGLGVSVAEVEKRFLSSFPVRAEKFKLRQRALHVFSEAQRVLQFLTLLERPVHIGMSDTTTYNEQLGDLMNETQLSCQSLYQCSCPEIDTVTRIAREAGAYGSRLTGAGWGGCTVHLVPADKVDAVKAALNKEYYSQLDLTDEQREQAVIISRPAGGSAIYMVDQDVR